MWFLSRRREDDTADHMARAEQEAPQVAKELARHALDSAHRQAAEVSEFSESLRKLRERNHFGEALDIAMQRRKPA